jgi:hypothetical protein
MATVYLAEDLKHGRRVAIKVLRPELAAAIGAERFVREIRTIAALQHSHILGLIDSGEAGGTAYYVMPYVAGGTLRDRLRREGPLAIAEAVRLTREVALALQYAHRCGLVHRDIKPENILLTADGEALVADFGIARLLGSADEALTRTGISLGTPAYMSPEQASGDKQVDHRSDIYALGAVLYEMLAGEPPFTGPTAQAIIAKRFSGAAPSVRVLRPEVAAPVEAVVARALARVPADRFATAAELATALSADVTPAGTTVTAGARPRPRRAVSAGFLMLVIGFALGLGVLFAWRREGGRGLHQHRVAAPVFVNKTGDAAFDPVVAHLTAEVNAGLAEIEGVEVIEGSNRRASAGTVLTGALYREGDSVQLSATIIDAASGKAVYTVGPVVASAQRPSDVVAPLSQRVIGGVAALLDPGWGGQGLLPLRPPRWDAYREFHQGDLSFYSEVEDSAFAHFAQAAALDPTFNLARLRAAQVLVNAGERFYSRADSALNAVRPARPSFSPFERAYLDWSWAWHRADWEGAYTAAVVMTEAAPRSDLAAYLRGVFANLDMRWAEAVKVLGALDPGSTTLRFRSAFYYFHLTGALHMLGQHRRELEEASAARERFPDQIRVRQMEIRALAAIGDRPDFERRVSQALAQAEGQGTAGPVLLVAAEEARAHGHPEIAQSALAHLAEWLAGPGATDSSVSGQRLRVDAFRLGDEWDRAGSLADSLVRGHPDVVTYLGLQGVIAAHLGERAKANGLAGRLAGMAAPERFGDTTLWQARIAARLGDRAQAVSLLRTAMAEGARLLASDDSDPDLESLRDYPPFLELTRARD